MSEATISIGQDKQNISQLVNRVNTSGERIILTSHGKPQAVLISLTDYERLKEEDIEGKIIRWQDWFVKNRDLTAKILAERQGEMIDVDALWESTRADLEVRHDELLGN